MGNRFNVASIYADSLADPLYGAAKGAGLPSTQADDDCTFVLKAVIDLDAGIPDYANAGGSIAGSLIAVPLGTPVTGDKVYLMELPKNVAVEGAYLNVLTASTGGTNSGTAALASEAGFGGSATPLIPATGLATAAATYGPLDATATTVASKPVVTTGTKPVYIVATLGGVLGTTLKGKFSVTVKCLRLT
jgi:hypothetical protein